MKILSLNQIKKMDQYCIDYESISSIHLMERAARSCFNWIINHPYFTSINIPFIILSGNGNNGGDGLCLARMLHLHGYTVSVYIINISNSLSKDFLISKKKALRYGVELKNIYEGDQFPTPLLNNKKDIYLIDAIFGVGYNRPIKSRYWKYFFYHINKNKFKYVISIDIPSGLFMEKNNNNFDTIIKANYTLSFQTPKIPFLLPNFVDYVGEWYLLDIGWDNIFLQKMNTKNILVDKTYIRNYLFNNKRKKFSHKGNYGHGIIIGGSYGMIGSIALSGEAVLRSGIGKLTIFIPNCGYDIIQNLVPEAIVKTNGDKYLNEIVVHDDGINAICIGMGMSKNSETINALENFLKNNKKNSIPMVIDADAINILSDRIDLLNFLPKNTIITPHPKEFNRLFGLWKNEYHKLNILRKSSKKYKIFIVLKGAHSIICTPKGVLYFNSTGNPGMSTAGSGDILSGIIMSFLSQGYSPKKSCIIGVYLHGLAGDIGSKKYSEQSVISRDINKCIGKAFSNILKYEI
ncbi:NAD(P)H-hydrate dehydratase [Blattabacterium cuenoti]|uniref:NAD(P)H-hydrate dehydratase n=1 Tax=Blattabacterium cuenoti TaxID=1653831 RepID=UPI00163B690B|nr:NAD(P)H-hydrate dehydratase [Blattabacterium cuenoti]